MNKSIVIYYTWAGHTKAMAEIISNLTGAALLEINPTTPYSDNYNTVVVQAKKEIQDGYLPSIKTSDYDLTRFDTIYIGTPIWWGTMAPPLASFLKEQDFKGKTIMPFSTHGGGGKGHCDSDIEKLCSGAQIMPMHTAYEGGGKTAEKDMAAWIENNLK